MSAVHALSTAHSPVPARAPERHVLLDDLRAAARRCEAHPRMALFEACAMLSLDRERSHAAFRDALLRTLPEALGRRPVFYRPGSAELSFDETWLVALMEAIARDDAPSVAFLTASRLRPHTRRNVTFLVTGTSRAA